MGIRKQTTAVGISLALTLASVGIAAEQNMSPGMMDHGNQGSMGSGMMNGMMGSQGGMESGMKGMMGGEMMPCPMMGDANMEKMQQMLDPEQREQMHELMQEHRPAQMERKERLMNLRDDLRTEMHGERPDPEKVQSLHGQMAALHGEMMAEMVRMRNAMHDMMTKEQRQQLEQAAPDSDTDHDAHH